MARQMTSSQFHKSKTLDNKYVLVVVLVLQLTVQIGKICGAIVIVVARGVEKIKLLKSMGVDHVVDLGTENVISSVKEFIKDKRLKGVDVLYDPVGGKLTKESMKVLKWRAQILVIGFASGEVPLIPAREEE